MAKRIVYPELNKGRCCNCYKGLTPETRVSELYHKGNNKQNFSFAYYCQKCHNILFKKRKYKND